MFVTASIALRRVRPMRNAMGQIIVQWANAYRRRRWATSAALPTNAIARFARMGFVAIRLVAAEQPMIVKLAIKLDQPGLAAQSKRERHAEWQQIYAIQKKSAMVRLSFVLQTR